MTNKRFEGVLICSDMDGTFAIGKSIPQNNIDAVKSFCEQGGKFTISSGRQAAYLDNLLGGLCNAPYICLNGTMIYDQINGKVLLEEPLDSDALEPVRYLSEKDGARPMYVVAYTKSGVTIEAPLEMFPFEECQGKTILKVVMVWQEEANNLNAQMELAQRFPQYAFSRSWWTGLEYFSRKVGKGVCVKWLKSHLGVHTLVCVGDFENDISMLQSADIAFAPENACPQVKALSPVVLCDVENGTLADLIEKLPDYLPPNR